MKLFKHFCLPLIFGLLFIVSAIAQDNFFTERYKENAIHELCNLMNEYYVLPDVAKATEKHLLKQLEDGHFNQFKDDAAFAEALTVSVQSINNDKHMRIRKNRPFVAEPNSPERVIEERLDQINRSRGFNSGFNTVEILEGNVGYLDLRGFAGLESGKQIADAYMQLMARTDAVIIDLSKNGGGSPRMVQYLCSYFFDDKRHLNSLYFREGDNTIDFWTLDEVGGEKMPEVPLFVITSERTFSGAEEFSYNMQTQKRATLIGQTSGGGANPGGTRPINENLSVFIPTGMAINPITKTSWEGIGVIPEIKTNIEETFSTAHKLAKDAAEEYRNKIKDTYTKTYYGLHHELSKNAVDISKDALMENLNACIDAGLMNEAAINMLGYEYLMEHKKPEVAEVIFKANTVIYPESANVYDSYAEALEGNGKLQEAAEGYKKAVMLAKENALPNDQLQVFEQNLARVKGKLGKK